MSSSCLYCQRLCLRVLDNGVPVPNPFRAEEEGVNKVDVGGRALPIGLTGVEVVVQTGIGGRGGEEVICKVNQGPAEVFLAD